MIFVRSQVEVGEPNQEAGAISEPHDTGHSDSRVISLLLFHVKQGVSKPGVRSASVVLERTGRYRADVAFR